MSVADAAIRAFTALKQPGGAWDSNGYGQRMIRVLSERFTEEQKTTLAGSFDPPATRGQTHSTVDYTRRFCDRDISTRFLNSVVAKPSRPHLAFEYNIPLESVGLALHHAVMTQVLTSYRLALLVSHHKNVLQRNLARLVEQHPEWSALANFEFGYGQQQEIFVPLHPPGQWPLPVPQEERDLLRRLENEARSRDHREVSIRHSLQGHGPNMGRG